MNYNNQNYSPNNYNQYGGTPNNNYQNSYYQNPSSIGWLLNPSTILGLISALLLTLGLLLPAMDFSHFHENVDIQYNLVKICKNVGLLSSMWVGIPYGIAIGIVGIVILSFVKTPALKLIPCFLITVMVALMIIDLGNVIEWVTDLLNKFKIKGITINYTKIVKSFTYGIYLLAFGLITAYISCFFKIKK